MHSIYGAIEKHAEQQASSFQQKKVNQKHVDLL